MTENEARFIAQRIFNSEDLYIMLSTTQANMMNGYSTPYIGILENGEKMLFLFTTYERAKAYVDATGYEVLDGIYPIAKIDQNDKYRNLYQICNIAASMGIENVDIDLGCTDAFGCKILWLLDVNDKKVEEVSILLSKEEADYLMNNETDKVPLRMNSMKIENFTNPYMITEEQTERLFKHLFNGSSSFEEIQFNFENNQTLLENCFLSDRINSKLIPQALHDEKDKEAMYFGQVSKILERVIWKKVFENDAYTMADKETGKIVSKNQAMYLVYTDRFKYMGSFEYVKIKDKETFMDVIKENNIKQLVVTDGPNYMCIINENTMFE